MIYWQIFISFFKVGFVTFGGGSAAVPWIEKEAVEKRGWINNSELINVVMVANLLPGASMVEMAAQVGNKVGGKRGGFIAGLAIGLPTSMVFLVTYIIAKEFLEPELFTTLALFVLPVVAAMILKLMWKLFKSSIPASGVTWSVFLFAFISVIALWGFPQAGLMIVAILMTYIFNVIRKRGNKICN